MRRYIVPRQSRLSQTEWPKVGRIGSLVRVYVEIDVAMSEKIEKIVAENKR